MYLPAQLMPELVTGLVTGLFTEVVTWLVCGLVTGLVLLKTEVVPADEEEIIDDDEVMAADVGIKVDGEVMSTVVDELFPVVIVVVNAKL